MSKRRKNNYINNKTLYEHMKVYHAEYTAAKERGDPKPVLPRYIAECILLISERLSHKRTFYKYSYREEMVLDAVENCVMYVHNFNPEKSKVPFAYITRMVRNAFIRRIEFEQRQQYAILANCRRQGIMDQLNPNQVMGETVELYDNLIDFMSDFERKNNVRISKKKEQRKSKAVPLVIVNDEFWAA